jgi:ribonuclease HII
MDISGIEEAGRGPVIGPMVMACVVIEKEEEESLTLLGIKDSKLLTPKKREELFEVIIKKAKRYDIIIIPPEAVDANLFDPEMNLNLLEAKVSAMLISKTNPDSVMLDCPSNNPNAYINSVKRFLKELDVKKEITIKAEHKADLNYPVVSAASILAKVSRDREIEKLKQKYKIDFGSGYPSDPKTKDFLAKYYDKYPIFRKSWASYKNIIESKKQKTLNGF